MAADQKILVERWLTNDGVFRRKQVIELLKEGKNWTKPLEGFIYVEDVPDHADLRGIDLRGFDFSDIASGAVAADYALFDGSQLRGHIFERCRLIEASFRGSNLVGASFVQAMARGANFDGADMRACFAMHADFSYASFRGTHLDNAAMEKTNCTNADFSGCYLRGTKLDGANLTGACMRGAIPESA